MRCVSINVVGIICRRDSASLLAWLRNVINFVLVLLLSNAVMKLDGQLRWRRSIVVRTLVSVGEVSLSCARLLAGWVTTL